MQLLLLGQRLESAEAAKLTETRHKLAQQSAKLEALSPLAILSRGYSVATGKDGKVLTRAAQSAVGDEISVRLSDGSLTATVTKITGEAAK